MRSNEREYQRWVRLKADAELIEAAARWLTSRANQEHFAGWQRPDRAYAMSSLLSMIALQLAEVPEPVRREAVQAARELTGEREAAGRASTRPGGAEHFAGDRTEHRPER